MTPPVGGQHALRHDALPLAEKIGKDAAKIHLRRLRRVGDGEAHAAVVGAHHRALRDQPAEAHARSGRERLLGELGRRIEEHDLVAEREEHERRGDGEHRAGAGDHGEPPLFARHGVAAPAGVTPRSAMQRLDALRGRAASRTPASAARAASAAASVPAEHDIGADQPQPALDVVGLVLQPRREPAHHAVDHRGLVAGRHALRGRDLLLRRTRARRFAGRDARQRLCDRRPPGRIGGRLRQKRRAARSAASSALALLLGGERQDRSAGRAPAGSSALRRLEGGARLGGHDAALRREDRLAEPGLPRRRRAEQADRVPIGLRRVRRRGRGADRPARSPPSRGRPRDSRQDAPRPSRSASRCRRARPARKGARRAAAPGRLGAPRPR